MDANSLWYGLMGDGSPPRRARILVVGAGSRGNAYARVVQNSTRAKIAAVAEPVEFKRNDFGRKYVWNDTEPLPGQAFGDWREFLAYELDRRKREAAGEDVEDGVDAAFICTLDEQHAEILTGLAPLNLHLLCEKPLATALDDCLSIYASLLPDGLDSSPRKIFGIGHVLRYSPHNLELRRLLCNDKIIGDVISIEHTEPVGWWHFSHSYVRGNWRKESTTAPSLLTKSCHDIDFLLWLLCSPPSPSTNTPPHLPAKVASFGHLNYFRRSRKPAAAGTATNCLSCPIERTCKYSAKQIYVDRRLRHGLTSWPVKIVNPEIEDIYRNKGPAEAEKVLLADLAEDYSSSSSAAKPKKIRPYFGRCVWESDNDVCDDQFVTITWDDNTSSAAGSGAINADHHPKTAAFHMIAHTEDICERRGRVYGTEGEISYDSRTIRVYNFATSEETIINPEQKGGGHGGGDDGLIRQFVDAVDAVRTSKMNVAEAQAKYIGCTLEEVIRSHAMAFAAEQARRESKVIDWKQWWAAEVEERMKFEASVDREYEIVSA